MKFIVVFFFSAKGKYQTGGFITLTVKRFLISVMMSISIICQYTSIALAIVDVPKLQSCNYFDIM